MITESLKTKHQPDLQGAADACRAVFFFGMPHDGATSAEWGLMLSNIIGTLPSGFSAYKNILRGLVSDSEKLSRVSRDFFDLLDEPIPAVDKIQIYSFQEGQPLTSIKTFDGKMWTCPKILAIERNSFIQDANHMSMCRFNSADSAGYKDFKAALKDYLDVIRAKQEASKRAKSSGVIQPAATLSNLDFQERLVREQQLRETHTIKESFQWIWSSVLVQWLKGSSPLSWIPDKPASGTSTLMSHIAKS